MRIVQKSIRVKALALKTFKKKKRNVTGCCWNLKDVPMSFKFDQKDLISRLKLAAIITKTNAIPVSIQPV